MYFLHFHPSLDQTYTSASVKCVRTESAIHLIGLDGLQVMLSGGQEQHRDRETHGKLRHPGGLRTVVSMGGKRVSVGRLRGHTSVCVCVSVCLLSYLCVLVVSKRDLSDS